MCPFKVLDASLNTGLKKAFEKVCTWNFPKSLSWPNSYKSTKMAFAACTEILLVTWWAVTTLPDDWSSHQTNVTAWLFSLPLHTGARWSRLCHKAKRMPDWTIPLQYSWTSASGSDPSLSSNRSFSLHFQQQLTHGQNHYFFSRVTATQQESRLSGCCKWGQRGGETQPESQSWDWNSAQTRQSPCS